MSVYPDAAEAVVVYRSGSGDGESSSSAWSDVPESTREWLNHQRATRRAMSESRRYLVANRLRYMWVLTFAAEVHDRRECMRLVADFAARFRATFGVQPYWYSPELHPEGHGWHVNFFVAKRLAHQAMTELWGLGHVWVSDWAATARQRGGSMPLLEAIRLGAQYACKYATKDWSDEALAGGAHRYEVAQGFAPRKESYQVPSFGGAVKLAWSHFGRPPDRTWHSADDPLWDGPPVWCLSWSTTGTDPPGGDPDG